MSLSFTLASSILFSHPPVGVQAWIVEGAGSSSERPDDDVEKLEKKARFLYGERAYTTSARLFEQLREQTGKAAYHFYAGLAREGAGHNAHAIWHWEAFLEQTSSDSKGRKDAKRNIRFAKRRTTPVRVEVRPQDISADDVTMSFARGECPEDVDTPVVWEADGQLQPLTVSAPDGQEFEAYLDRGSWCAKIEFTGYEPAMLAIAVPKPSTKLLTLELELVKQDIEAPHEVEDPEDTARQKSHQDRGKSPVPEVPRIDESRDADRYRLRGKRLALGLGIAGGVSAGLGVGFVAGGVTRFKNLQEGDNASVVTTLYDAGSISLGFTLGAGVSTLTAWHISRNHSRAGRVWGVELAIGASAIAGGLTGYFVQRTGKRNVDTGDIKQALRRQLPVLTLAGFGGALVVNSILGLALQHHKTPQRRKLSVYPVYSNHFVGAGIHSRF